MSGVKGSSLVEAQNINLSLSLLGNVLNALSKFHRARSYPSPTDGVIESNQAGDAEPASPPRRGLASSAVDRPFIPYRDSKLTHLLKDSLGGNCKTLMVCAVRTAPACFQQTMMSLRLGYQYFALATLVRFSHLERADKLGLVATVGVTRLAHDRLAYNIRSMTSLIAPFSSMSVLHTRQIRRQSTRHQERTVSRVGGRMERGCPRWHHSAGDRRRNRKPAVKAGRNNSCAFKPLA